MSIVMAVILGMAFGFVLQKVGAANPQKIINMLRFRDLHLMKAILLGIGVSSLLLFVLLVFGIADSSHLSVKDAYVGVVVGGLILGLGWAISGFCPGTGVVAAGAGRKDAQVFIIGGLVGAFIYTLVYGSIKDSFLFSSLGGKVTLAVTGSKYGAMLVSFPGLAIAGGTAGLFIAIALVLPEKVVE
ncbi:DUF6691 family protein [Maridesulfovibrio sp.]|uniref:DUF6691 family protein n=1 Tax=Maridesulfovibrio sp. TaxID=2795000 RepID=UPI003BAA1AC5